MGQEGYLIDIKRQAELIQSVGKGEKRGKMRSNSSCLMNPRTHPPQNSLYVRVLMEGHNETHFVIPNAFCWLARLHFSALPFFTGLAGVGVSCVRGIYYLCC